MTAEVIDYRFRVRRGTAADLATVNEIPLQGEWIEETDTKLMKLGDGSTHYNSLRYYDCTFFAVASGTNTITASFASAPVLYDGLMVRIRAAAANTGAVTFNPNSLGALAITKLGGTALVANEIAAAGHELILVYRSSVPRWELLNPGPGAAAVIYTATASGADTITATISPVPTLSDFLEVRLRAAAANTGAATFNANGGGAIALTKEGGVALDAGDIAGAGHELILRYVSSVPRWELLNPSPPAGGGGSAGATMTSTVVQGSHGFGLGQVVSRTAAAFFKAERGSSSRIADGLVSVIAAGATDTDCKTLLNLDGTNGATTTTDAGVYGRTFTFAGSAALSTTQQKFGTASLACPSNGSWISAPNTSSQNEFGSADFTEECWFYPTSSASGRHIWAYTDNSGNDEFRVVCNVSTVQWLWYHSGAYKVNISGGAITLNAWNCIAVERYGNVHNLLLNGVVVATTTISHTQPTNSSRKMLVGGADTLINNSFIGYIDGFRSTKGVSRYLGAGYTPLTSAFSASGSTGFDMVTAGELVLGTGDWSAVTDDASPLVDGAQYYLSTTPGFITRTEPTTGRRQRIGKALSTTKLLVEVGPSVDLDRSGPFGGVAALSIASGVVAINALLGPYFTLTANAAMTSFTFSNLPASGQATTLMILIAQDATGARVATWPASFKWLGGTAGVLSTAATTKDLLVITTFDQGTTWYATLSKAYS